jgi:hypothetical protein
VRRQRLKQRIVDLEASNISTLRLEWEQVIGASAPNLSADLLRLGLAWQLQAKALGGLSRAAKRVIDAPPNNDASAMPRALLSAGTRLVRDWHGVSHTVTVLEDGFDYDGHKWRSLTAIARHITGAKWSGPRFFGLTGTPA